MLYQQPRATTVYCEQNISTWALDRKTYTHIMHNTFIKKRALYTEFLSKISFLQSMSHKELIQLADALQPDKFKKGEHLISYGEEGTWFYIIVEGVVEVLGRNDKGEKIPVCTFTRGECVGELEFLHNHNTVADVVAQTEEVRVAKLNRAHFEMCMGPIKELLKQSRAVDPVFSYYRGTQEQGPPNTQQITATQIPKAVDGLTFGQVNTFSTTSFPVPLPTFSAPTSTFSALNQFKTAPNYQGVNITPRLDFFVSPNDLTPRFTPVAPAYNEATQAAYSTSLVPFQQAPTYTYNDPPFPFPLGNSAYDAPTYASPYHHPSMYSASTYTHPLPEFGFFPHGPAPTYIAPQTYLPPPLHPSPYGYRTPHSATRGSYLPFHHPSSYAYSSFNQRSFSPFDDFGYPPPPPLYSPPYLPANDYHVPSYALTTPRRFTAPPLYGAYSRFSNRPPIDHLYSSQYTAPSPVWSRPFY
eukprot:NODE_2213_length_1652_cov_135.017005_g1896_i0.p1 GENE.NODE_2213_length_1652_cov_135.017005_g1896_i0~~NODE_2213_length_1652_cov_135.017005_g1896_i0.p1  ORF type:complete len:506 (+),score=109.72 NODE_2213_length_1652_cov_135.017005_g1896_i0:113-1519(+)